MNKLSHRHARRVLPITSVITFLGFLDTHLLIPIIALYAYKLGASVGIIGLIIGLYSITNTPANILFGRLIDRVGYKVPLMAGLIGDALSMFCYSICRLPIHLALVRVIHGASGGLIGPATMSITADYSDKAQKGRAMGFYGMSLAAATLVGYGLSGVIVSQLGYQALFMFGVIMLVVGATLTLLLPKASKRGNMAAKVSISESFRKVKGLLRRRGLTVAYCSIFAQYFAFGGVVTLLPLYVRSLGMETFHVGMLLATFAIMFIIVQFPSGALSDRVGRLIPTSVGLSLSIVSLVMLPSLETFSLLAVVMALYGTAYGILFPSISALVADHTIPEERGMATGMFHALLTAGVATGAPIIGWAGEIMGVELGLALSSVIVVLALVVALIVTKS
ncbi:MAG TPA: MFS transporter [Dehalococcoidia bacterium]|nr:MFS transporter [Dehalococcoidia bacterium]